jgi:hypothetical protein
MRSRLPTQFSPLYDRAPVVFLRSRAASCSGPDPLAVVLGTRLGARKLGKPAYRWPPRWPCKPSSHPGASSRSWSLSANGFEVHWRKGAFPSGSGRRVILVLALDSSIKTSLAGSKPSCRRRHALRARAMSGGPCSLARSVFFYMSAPYRSKRSEWQVASSPSPKPPAIP